MKIVLVILAMLWVSTPLLAASEPKADPKQQQHPVKREISKEKATRLAQERYPGRVLKVQSDSRQFKVRVMQSDGRVVNVVVDGRNGRVQREE